MRKPSAPPFLVAFTVMSTLVVVKRLLSTQVTSAAEALVCRKVLPLSVHVPFFVVQSAAFRSLASKVVSEAVTVSPVKVALVAQVPTPMEPWVVSKVGALSCSVHRTFWRPTLLLNMRCT